jgi:hypothetical protein
VNLKSKYMPSVFSPEMGQKCKSLGGRVLTAEAARPSEKFGRLALGGGGHVSTVWLERESEQEQEQKFIAIKKPSEVIWQNYFLNQNICINIYIRVCMCVMC